MNGHPITRRRALATLGALGLVGAGGATLASPRRAEAQQLGVHETSAEALKRLFGSRPIKDGAGVVKLDVPLIAENGAVVPVGVEVASPMTAANHVKAIYVVADKNRIPVVFRTTLGPEAGQAAIGATIRLGETTDVRAIVEQSDGTLVAVSREVKVTVGGCGG
jgi:sulfur-oxidizing protein SoxY